MTQTLHVLLVEDSEADAELTVRELRRGGFAVHSERVEEADALRAAIDRGTWDLVISDWHLPRFGALEAITLVRAVSPRLPILVVSGTIGEETATDALHAGALDFVVKGKLTRLLPAVHRCLREVEAHEKAEKALRESEERLRQAQKMEAIGSLAGGIAHDFNNMLSVILSYAELASDTTDGNELRADMLEIRRAAERASELTRQLLAFSRKQMLQPRAVDLNRLVAGFEKMLRRVLREDIQLSLQLVAKSPMVFADPGQIEQVLMNLVVNARDAMPGGGTVSIETGEAYLDAGYANQHADVAEGWYAAIVVSDTGTGMDKKTQDRIFEPFFTTKELGQGTGLGLSTVFGIVKQSGGHLSVRSELGRGTTFRIYLPLDPDAKEGSAPPEEPPVTVRGTETVLLVEDESQVRTLVGSVLRRNGYEVLEAQNPGEALILCEKHAGVIHLTITDVVMPRMGGRELADRLSALRPEMRVLYISGYAEDAIVHHGVLDAGIWFLPKPFTPPVLLRKVREVLDAGRLA